MNIYIPIGVKKNHLDILSTGTGYLKTKFSKFSEEIALSRYASVFLKKRGGAEGYREYTI